MSTDVSREDTHVASIWAGSFLFILSVLLGISLLMSVFSLSGTRSVFSVPGSILFSVYGFTSFLVPCFILSAAILLLVPGWTIRAGVLLGGAWVPFLTVAGGERLVRTLGLTIGNRTFALLISLGLLLSTLLAVLVEYIILLHLGDRLALNAERTPLVVQSYYVEEPDTKVATPAMAVSTEKEAQLEAQVELETEPQAKLQDELQTRLTEEIESLSDFDLLPEFDEDEAIFVSEMTEPETVAPEAVAPEAVAPEIIAPEIIAPEVAAPVYVDFQKMKAPYDPSAITDWADMSDDEDSFEDENPDDDLNEIDFEAELAEAADEVSDEDAYKDADQEPKIPVSSNLKDDYMPPVVSIPPVAHETAPVAETPFWKKKKRGIYSVPVDILTSYPDGEYWIVDETTRRAAAALKETLNEFSIQAEVTGIRKGPVITMFEILPAPGVKLSKIVGLQDNIALRLAASSVRIVAPIPGKHAVGIEVPNLKRSIVSFRELIETDTPASKKMEIPVVLGKDITGEAQLLDLASTPHLLIAGSTGSGKSVCVNSIILSILYKRSPEDVKLILIDPKIVELKLYNDIGHLLAPVITEPKKAFQALQYCLCEMERRYALLDGMGVRDIKSYNKRIRERNIATEKLPYLVVIIDEFADLMATTGKELESTVARLCAMSRAVGIHLVLATQRPSIDVITGLIKANIPSRIAFMVASKMDSRIIIDQMGAEKLLGRGDMLYSSATDPFPVRIQGAFVSEEEVERVVAHVKTLGEPEYIDEEIFVEDDDEGGVDPSLFSDGEDPLYDKALEIVLLAGKASASYIQRRLKIGYNRAARLVEDMEARGIVGPANGSKPREVVHHP